MRSFTWMLLPLSFLGCGGKIVDAAPIGDGPIAPVSAPAREDHATTEPQLPKVPPSNPTPATATPRDACKVLCDRDARCDTTLPALPVREDEQGDCEARCERRLEEKCGIDDWLLCFASHIEPATCTPLPAECRPSFCAWSRCAKQPVSNCD